MNAHTWKATRFADGTVGIHAPDGSAHVEVAICRGGNAEKHGRLIAAAPEMLTSERDNLIALENLLSYLRKHEAELPPFSTSSLEVRIAKTRAVIAKAEGR